MTSISECSALQKVAVQRVLRLAPLLLQGEQKVAQIQTGMTLVPRTLSDF